MSTPYVVYQAYGEGGLLLYVGLSRHWPNRWQAHSRQHPWWRVITQVSFTRGFTHREAIWLEAFWIATLLPYYNRIHPEIPPAPDSLTTHCSHCATVYAVSLRPPGARCDDLSLRDPAGWPANACAGHCELQSYDGEWECLS